MNNYSCLDEFKIGTEVFNEKLGKGIIFDVRAGDYPIGVRFGNNIVYLTSELKLTKDSLDVFINI